VLRVNNNGCLRSPSPTRSACVAQGRETERSADCLIGATQARLSPIVTRPKNGYFCDAGVSATVIIAQNECNYMSLILPPRYGSRMSKVL
jgi:hypothetical protein